MMARASSAPPALRYSGGIAAAGSAGVVAMPTVGEVVDASGREEEGASSWIGSASGPSSPVAEGTSKTEDDRAAEGMAKKEGGTAAASVSAVAAVETEETPQEGGADPTAVEKLGATSTGGVEGSSSGGVEETPVASEPASGSVEEGMTAVVAPAGQDEGKAAEEAAEREAYVARGAAATSVARAAAKAARAGEEKTPVDEEEGGGGAAAADGTLEAAVQTNSQPRRMGPRAMPSISVIQRFEVRRVCVCVCVSFFYCGISVRVDMCLSETGLLSCDGGVLAVVQRSAFGLRFGRVGGGCRRCCLYAYMICFFFSALLCQRRGFVCCQCSSVRDDRYLGVVRPRDGCRCA